MYANQQPRHDTERTLACPVRCGVTRGCRSSEGTRPPTRPPHPEYASIAYGDRNATVTLDPAAAPASLANASSVARARAYVLLNHTWTTSISPVVTWSWPTLTTSWTAQKDMGSNRRVAVQNAAAPADLAPGTFTFDPAARTLTYRLAPGEAAGDLPALVVPALCDVVVVAGTSAAPVESVSLVNLTLAHTAAALEEDCMVDCCSFQGCADGSGAAVHVHGARGWRLQGVEVAYTGDIATSGARTHDLGAGGARVGLTAQACCPTPRPSRAP